MARRSRRSSNSPTVSAKKRKLGCGTNHISPKQQLIGFPTQANCDCQDISLLDIDDNTMAFNSSSLSSQESNNHKISLTNHHNNRLGTSSNQGRKASGGKKIVIKNLKGPLSHSLSFSFIHSPIDILYLSFSQYVLTCLRAMVRRHGRSLKRQSQQSIPVIQSPTVLKSSTRP